MTESDPDARAILHAFFLQYPAGDRVAFEDLRSRHIERAAELDRLYAEVAELRTDLHLSPASIVGAMGESVAPVSITGLPTDRRRPRIPGIEIIAEVGHGGMGVIWSGRDIELGRAVAVKVLHEKLAGDEAARKRFIVEARVTGQLQHPGIAPVYRLGVSNDGLPFLSMKLIRGRTLARILKRRATPDSNPLELLSVFKSICETVSYAHSRGVVHRDLKPANVMVGSFGEVQVLDWGLAKVLNESESDPDPDASVITPFSPDSPAGGESLAGSVVGTPSYMAPEQAGGGEITRRSDVYSLGGVLCEILTGGHPVAGEDEAANRHLKECDADRELVELTRSCLALDPYERPANADEVAGRIASYLASVDQRARAAELEAGAARVRLEQERRLRRRTVALGSALMVALLVASFAFRQTWQTRVLAAEGTVLTLANARALFEKGDYEGSASAAQSALEQVDQLGSLEEEFKLLAKNAELMSRLSRYRPRTNSMLLNKEQHREIRAEFQQAFLDHGVDVLRDTALAAQHLRNTGVQDLARPLLDQWTTTEFYLDGWESSGASCLLALASALDEDTTRREMREIISQTQDRDVLRAFLGSERAQDLDPSTLILLIETVALLFGDEVSGDAISDAHKAALGMHDRYPDDVKVLLQLAECSFGLAMREHDIAGGALTPKARTYFHETVEHLGGVRALDPDGATAWALLGYVYTFLGDTERSDVAFSEAVQRIWTETGYTSAGPATLMSDFGETARVIAHLETLVAAHPNTARVWHALAWNLCNTPPPIDVQRALTAARRAVELDPEYFDARAVLGRALFYAEEFDECADTLRPLLDVGLYSTNLNLMYAICLHEQDQEDEAGTLGRRWLRTLDTGWGESASPVIDRARELFEK